MNLDTILIITALLSFVGFAFFLFMGKYGKGPPDHRLGYAAPALMFFVVAMFSLLLLIIYHIIN